ncbi:GNAT family N-acetyltransferase, partial [Enterococcus durans]
MIRFAKKEDAHEIAPLILVILNDMELPFLQKYGTTKTLEILEEAITDPT